jgi:hypothetical protein
VWRSVLVVGVNLLHVLRRNRQCADVDGLGGFFLIGGVLLFFDRAMYASPPLPISSNGRS